MKKLISRFSRPDRKLASRRPTLFMEPLEERQMLAVTATDDTFTIPEHSSFPVAHVAVPLRSQWTRFEGITRVAPTNVYPDGGGSPDWNDVNYNTATPSFGTWTAPAVAPFVAAVVDGLTAPTTALSNAYIPAGGATNVTALFRTNFTSAGSASSGSGRILCDDACIVYVNGQEVFRSTNFAAGAVGAGTDANGAGSETAFSTFSFSNIPLTNNANNVFAVEMHQDGAGSSDIGFDAELTYFDSNPTTRTNDSFSAPTTAVSTYYWDGIADTSLTTATSGPAIGTGAVISGGNPEEFPVGRVTIDPATGNFTFTPTAGTNYSGPARFTYLLRDNANPANVASANVTINITAVNDAPVGVADAYTSGQGTSISVTNAARPNQIISKGALWYYKDDGSNQSTVINQPAFNPTTAGWSVGYAELGYGDGDEKTVINCDAAHSNANGAACANTSNFITSYYSRPFKLTSIPAELQINIRRDDGAVIYINGIEVVRTGMPATGAIDNTTVSPGTSSETDYFQYRIPTAGLGLSTATDNVISVSIHNVNLTSSDMSFDMEMYAPVSPAAYINEHDDWFYKDDGLNHSAEMTSNQNVFNPSSWLTHGPAELGFGDGDEQTVIRCDMAGSNSGGATCANTNNIITQYFARNFDIPGTIPSQLLVHIRRDDGAVVYINGVEVLRSGLPATGVIDNTTVAAGTSSETDFFNYVVPTAGLNLQASGNVIAVEVHQVNITSSDLSFALTMESGSLGLLANDSDAETVTSSLTAVNLNQAGLAGLGSVVMNADGTFVFTPTNASSQGVGTFTYQVSDGVMTSAPVTVTITLTSTDIAPVVAVDDVFNTNEDVPLHAVTPVGPLGVGLLGNDTTDPADVGDPLTVSIVTAPIAAQGTVTLDAGNTGGFTFTPAANFNGDATFTYKVNDGFTDSNVATVTIHVAPQDDAPTAVTDTYLVYEDRVLTISDTAPTTLIAKKSNWDYFKTLAPGGTYPQDASSNAWNSVAFSATGAGWANAPAPFVEGTIDSVPAADPKTPLTSSATITTDLFRKTFTIASGAANISLLVADLLADDGVVIYINGHEIQRVNIAAGAVIPSTFAGGAGGTAGSENSQLVLLPIPAGVLVDGPNTIAVELHAVNLTSTDKGFDMALGTVPGVIYNDTDPEGDAVNTSQVVVGPQHGSLTLNTNGTFTYTPVANYNGPDSFTYTVKSGTFTSTPGTVNITVLPSPDPVVANNDTFNVPSNSPEFDGNVLTNDVGDAPLRIVTPSATFIDGAGNEFDWLNLSAEGANFVGDGSFAFFPAGVAGDFLPSGVPLTYTVRDANGATATATITIHITSGGPTGDFNNDSVFNRADLRILLAHFGQTGAGAATWDLDGDSNVGVQDAIVLRNKFVGVSSPAAAAVVATTRGAAVDSAIARVTEGSSRLVARRRVAAVDPTSTLGGSTETTDGSTETSLRARRSIAASAVDSVLSRSRR
jgi:VCBS repeat-containing protein